MSCQKASIPITATSKEVQAALEKYARKDDDDTTWSHGAVPTSHLFTPEVFLDLIVEWIIGGDQVCIYYSVWFLC